MTESNMTENNPETNMTEGTAEAQTTENKPETNIAQVTAEVNPIPVPPPQQTPVTSAQALKERLDWGEPALTILDARDRESFLEEHITGAMLLSDVENALADMSANRDIYVYGESDEQITKAIDKISQAGIEEISQLKGGLSEWKAIAGPTEGRVA